EAFLGKAIYSLQGIARRSKKPFYFILDGLNQVPSHEKACKRLIWEALPTGLPGFKFLITHDSGTSLDVSLPANAKTLLIPSFSLDDAARYLSDFNLSQGNLEEFHR